MNFKLPNVFQFLNDRLQKLRQSDELGTEQGMSTAERLSIFFICYLFAVAMWSLVNLGREFEITLTVPIELGVIPPDYVLTQTPISEASVTVNGEGWMLMSIYNGNPKLVVPINPEKKTERFMLLDQMKREMNSYPNINLISVEPSEMHLNLEKRAYKKVSVKPNVSIQYKSQYSNVSDPRVFPDSVLLSGPADLIKSIQFIETEKLELTDVKESIDVTLKILSPSDKIRMDRLDIRYRNKVSEYTEGEIRVFVKTHDLPKNAQVRYSPAVISIRYDVPIEEYAASQEIVPYSAFVNYREISNDSTGFVTPIIQNDASDLHLRLRSYQPKRVSYYHVIPQE